MDIRKLVIKEIVDVASVFQTKGKTLNIKDRKYYALSFSTGGKITYNCNGKIYNSDCAHVIFHPKNSTYSLTCLKSGTFPLIEFELVDERFTEFMAFKITSSHIFMKLYNEMNKNFVNPDKTAKNLSLLYEIFDFLYPYTKTSNSSFLTPVINEIHSNFNDCELTVSSLAKQLHVSECYFRKKFSEVFGTSPKKYLNNQRIKYAMHLLKEGNKTVTEIAELSGFSNVYYFSKVFKEQLNMTASEYAKQNTKNEL